MADEKLGFQLTEELGKEFRKIGTAGYPIQVINKANGETYSIVGYDTEKVEGGYKTWIVVEQVDDGE